MSCDSHHDDSATNRPYGKIVYELTIFLSSVWDLPCISHMNFLKRLIARRQTPKTNLKHEFVIGQLRTSGNSSPGRYYYCRRCNWSFLVCGSRIAALDGDGNPIPQPACCERFQTFENGPCPGLTKLISEPATYTITAPGFSRRKLYQAGVLPPTDHRGQVIPLLRVGAGLR